MILDPFLFVDSLRCWIAAGRPIPPQRVIADRLTECEKCPHRIAAVLQLCGVCGCVLAGKTKMATESCPLKHWSTYEGPETTFENNPPEAPFDTSNPPRCCG